MSNTTDPYDLTDKTAVVIGASGVLCREIALGLARRGARVVAVGHSRPERVEALVGEIEKAGGTAIATTANVLKKAELEALLATACEAFGGVDILVNGAGGAKPEATTSGELSFFDLPEDAVRWVFDLNFMGTFFACQVFGRHMAERERGAILNIASMGAFQPLTRSVAYSAAKAAVVNFTQWLAVHMSQEYSPAIRVNAVSPGFFLTDQNRFLVYDEATGDLTERGGRIVAGTPVGRLGDPSELVEPAIMLVSDAASFVHGATLAVDGGFSAYGGV